MINTSTVLYGDTPVQKWSENWYSKNFIQTLVYFPADNLVVCSWNQAQERVQTRLTLWETVLGGTQSTFSNITDFIPNKVRAQAHFSSNYNDLWWILMTNNFSFHPFLISHLGPVCISIYTWMKKNARLSLITHNRFCAALCAVILLISIQSNLYTEWSQGIGQKCMLWTGSPYDSMKE